LKSSPARHRNPPTRCVSVAFFPLCLRSEADAGSDFDRRPQARTCLEGSRRNDDHHAYRGGEDKDALIHDVQFHPVTGRLLHADFYVLEKGKKIKISVPLEFEGAAPAEKAATSSCTRCTRLRSKSPRGTAAPPYCRSLDARKSRRSRECRSDQNFRRARRSSIIEKLTSIIDKNNELLENALITIWSLAFQGRIN